jgi:hypothetical protein
MIQRKTIFTICVLFMTLLLALRTQNVTIDSKAFAELPVPTLNSNTTTNNNATMTMHTSNSIQGSNFNVLKQEEPVIRKLILSNVDNAISVAKASIKSAIPVNVNTKIINQLTNSGVVTTQGVDMTKKIIAIELTDAINTIAPNFASHVVHQPIVVVDNQAICNGIASPTKASCSFTINLHG